MVAILGVDFWACFCWVSVFSLWFCSLLWFLEDFGACVFPGKGFLDVTSGHWELWIQHVSVYCELTLGMRMCWWG